MSHRLYIEFKIMQTKLPVHSFRAVTAALLAFGLNSSLAFAICGSPVNPDATDPAIRGKVTGTWYSENQNPQLGMVQRIYQTFSANGLFDYRDQTCGNIQGMPCSQNAGHGVWNAQRHADGSFYIRVQFSDLRRKDECTGWAATFPDPNTMLMSNNTRAKRVQ